MISLFFLVFLAAGCLILWLATVGPLLRVVLAQSWQEVPCTITSSEVVGDDTWKVEIHYDYEFANQRYSGDRYSFFDLKTSGKAGKERIVQQFAPGAQSTCYVNPGQPMESVLNRQVSSNLLWGLFGLPFFLVGFFGLYGTLVWGRKSTTAATTPIPDYDSEADTPPRTLVSNSDFDDDDLREEPGPVTLKPESTPLTSFLVLTLFTLIWNGVVLGISAARFSDWAQGKWSWMPELLLIPFGLVGLLLIFGMFHSLLGLWNPFPMLTLSRRMIPLGGTAKLTWSYSGSPHAIQRISVTLKGMEEARYTRGTDRHTDTAVFYEQEIHESLEPASIAGDEIEIRIPPNSMHSFTAPNNKIVWQLNFRGEIPYWPDVRAGFTIRVVPHE